MKGLPSVLRRAIGAGREKSSPAALVGGHSEAAHEGPVFGMRVDALQARAASLFTRPYRPGGVRSLEIRIETASNPMADRPP